MWDPLSFELIAMFFSLMNSPATFQAMMNNIFCDLINKEDVAIFISTVLVRTETEKEHDKLVEKILKRLGRITHI